VKSIRAGEKGCVLKDGIQAKTYEAQTKTVINASGSLGGRCNR